MNPFISRRVQRVKPSATMAMTARAARLRAEGRDVISLSVGEPDFDTPEHIVAAGIEALRTGHTRYTEVGGTNELKDAIIAKFERDQGLRYERAQILVSSGAKQTIYNLCLAVLDPKDEAIIPSPYWVSYPDMVRLANALPVTPDATAASGYKITPKQLGAAITPHTKLLLLNSPSNPTGAAYTRAELRALGSVLLDHPRVLIGTDDIYEKIYWGREPFCSLAEAVPELYGRTVTINGVSKAYAMTGWRLGYCGGPKDVVQAMATIQGQSTTNASSIAQRAAIAALNGPQDCVARMNESYRARHDLVVAGLNAIPGLRCLPGAGTFYAFVHAGGAIRELGLRDDIALSEHLLEHGLVATVPGSAFGSPDHLRLSFATSTSLLEQALERIARMIRAGRPTRGP